MKLERADVTIAAIILLACAQPLLAILCCGWTAASASSLGVFLVSLVVLFVLRRHYLDLPSQLQRRFGREGQESRARAMEKVARSLVDEEDLLTGISNWSAEHQSVDPVAKQEFERLTGRLLASLRHSLDLEPILKPGERTRFDPATQTTFDRLTSGDTVEVVSPGWRLNRQTIKRPLVRRVTD